MISTQRANLFRGYDIETLNNSLNTCIAVDRDFNMVFLNQAYFKFAEDNNGIEIHDRFNLGTNFLDAISGDFRKFYREFMQKTLDQSKPGSFDYECSSARVFRKFRLLAYPLQDRAGLLMEHSLIVSCEHDREAVPFEGKYYIDEHGILHQCGHCRRIRNLPTQRWDWCPGAMDFKDVSHGMCDTCVDYYYPEI